VQEITLSIRGDLISCFSSLITFHVSGPNLSSNWLFTILVRSGAAVHPLTTATAVAACIYCGRSRALQSGLSISCF
jgi:hypothetical protein